MTKHGVDFSKLNKQIYYVKIIIGEECPFRCSYCFVDKEAGRHISYESIQKCIELLMFSPGHNKLLHLLGGEPLLYFELIKKVVLYSRFLEKNTQKQLDISFCTSGLGFTQDKLDFIRDNNIYLAWSIDGPAHIHDKNRIFLGGKASFNKIISYKTKIVSSIRETHLGIAMTVDENTVSELFSSYKYLIEYESFSCTINIAPVDGKIWLIDLQKIFIHELIKIYEYIFENIALGKFFFLNALNKEFRFSMLTAKNKGRCLWFYTEILTNGDIVFNPFINKEEDYKKFIVANIGDTDFLEKVNQYIDCRFDNESKKCGDCRNNYSQDINKNLQTVQMNKLLFYRDRISVYYANKIRILQHTDIHYKEYIELASRYMHV